MAESPWPSPRYILAESPFTNPNGMAESENFGRVTLTESEYFGRIREYFGRVTLAESERETPIEKSSDRFLLYDWLEIFT